MKKYLPVFCLLILAINSDSQVSFVLTNTICIGNSVNVTANTGTFAAIGYTWTSSPPAVIAASNNSATAITFTDGANYTITLTADDGTTIATDAQTISAGPQIIIAPAISINCPPPTPIGPTNLVASGAVSYTWMPGALIGGTVAIPNPAVSTTFTVFVTDANGCPGSAEQYWPRYPYPSISASGPGTACAGNTVCFTVSSFNILFWVWSGPCSFSSSVDCFTLSAGCSGSYTVGGVDGNSCLGIDLVSISVSPCTEVEELEHVNLFSIFPNPAKEKISVKLNSEIKSAGIEITDALGRVVSRQPEAFVASDLIDINISKLNQGLYFIKLISDNVQADLIKFVKE